MDLEKRLERLEKLVKGLWIGLAAGLTVAGLACVLSLVAICLRPAAPSDAQPSEKPEAVEARKTSYLDELERLEALKSKGAITQQEFDTKKAQLLAAVPAPAARGQASDMDELEKLLRNVQTLYNQNTITNNEYNEKKRQYLQRKVTVTDLQKDLKKAEKLYNENILTNTEWNALKQQILAGDPALSKK